MEPDPAKATKPELPLKSPEHARAERECADLIRRALGEVYSGRVGGVEGHCHLTGAADGYVMVFMLRQLSPSELLERNRNLGPSRIIH